MATRHRDADGLTRQERIFVAAYTASHNGTEAAIAAGYTKRNAAGQASGLLTRAHIQKAVAEREKSMADELGMTAEWVLEKLRTVIDAAIQPTPVLHRGEVVIVTDPDTGRETILTEINAGAATKAIELLMRHRGMLVERAEIKVDESVTYTLTLDRELPDQPTAVGPATPELPRETPTPPEKTP